MKLDRCRECHHKYEVSEIEEFLGVWCVKHPLAPKSCKEFEPCHFKSGKTSPPPTREPDSSKE